LPANGQLSRECGGLCAREPLIAQHWSHHHCCVAVADTLSLQIVMPNSSALVGLRKGQKQKLVTDEHRQRKRWEGEPVRGNCSFHLASKIEPGDGDPEHAEQPHKYKLVPVRNLRRWTLPGLGRRL
jgi:hypothetical protein